MHLRGIEGYPDVPPVLAQTAFTATFGLAILVALGGNVPLGVAVWRSGTLPKLAGAIWAASALLPYVLGAVLGMLTTGCALVTQPVAALLMRMGGGWMAVSAPRGPSARAAGVRAQPRAR